MKILSQQKSKYKNEFSNLNISDAFRKYADSINLTTDKSERK